MLLDILRKYAGIFLILLCSFSHADQDPFVETVFTELYDKKLWGVNADGGVCGSGSTLAATEQYRAFLTKFLQTRQIQSVVDFGCGDWAFSHAIPWGHIEYTGLDVVKSLIDLNQQKFSKPNIHFIHADGLSHELPAADLLICKDVLQHLSNEDVLQFLGQLNKFKYCLITNDTDPATQTSDNPNIVSGNHRWIDLTRPPFSVRAAKVMTYRENGNAKQVLLIENVNLQKTN